MDIDNTIFTYTLISSFLIILSNILKEGLSQVKKDNGATKIVSLILHIIAILLFSYSVGFSGTFGFKTPISFIAGAMMIVGVVLVDKTKLDQIGMALSIVGMISFAVIGGFDKTNLGKTLTLSSIFFLLLNQYVIMPYQRKAGMVDGPGMSMEIMSWLAYSLGNSMVF